MPAPANRSNINARFHDTTGGHETSTAEPIAEEIIDNLGDRR